MDPWTCSFALSSSSAGHPPYRTGGTSLPVRNIAVGQVASRDAVPSPPVACDDDWSSPQPLSHILKFATVVVFDCLVGKIMEN